MIKRETAIWVVHKRWLRRPTIHLMTLINRGRELTVMIDGDSVEVKEWGNNIKARLLYGFFWRKYYGISIKEIYRLAGLE